MENELRGDEASNNQALHFVYFMSNPVTYVLNVLSHCSMNLFFLLTLTEICSTRAYELLDH